MDFLNKLDMDFKEFHNQGTGGCAAGCLAGAASRAASPLRPAHLMAGVMTLQRMSSVSEAQIEHRRPAVAAHGGERGREWPK
jgi:hypothetical protein